MRKLTVVQKTVSVKLAMANYMRLKADMLKTGTSITWLVNKAVEQFIDERERAAKP